MYSCSKCQRTYRTQNSLTRHAHSHRNDKQHQCITCGVIFYRKDLLSRHTKLHQKSHNSSARPTVSDDDAGTGSRRQRCHTACDRCRELRTRCNGQNPCHSCRKANLNCQYFHRSNRLSHLPREDEAASDDRVSREYDIRASQTETVNNTFQQLIPGANDKSQDSQVIAQSDSGLQQDFHISTDCSLPSITFSTAPSGNLTITDDSSMADMLTWPWLHEDLFLPAEPDFFALASDPMASHSLRNNQHVDSELDQSLVGISFTAANHHVNQDGSAKIDAPIPCRHEDGPAAWPATPNGRDMTIEQGSLNFPGTMTPRMEKSRIIQDLVTFASAPSSATKPNEARARFWEAASAKVASAFKLPHREDAATPLALYRFCNEYVEHFAPLWPLLGPHSLHFDALHPLLFLVLTSIGAMYCGPQASGYGATMHASIRAILTTALELEDDEHDFVWLAQARLLTQVAALYFGQPKAFTYAHHLGALLVAQARRNNLFSAATVSSTLRKFHQMKGIAPDDERFLLWLQLETRRRLAFGIFRGDTYTSALLHTKPLISMEEIDLSLPTCDAVWRGHTLSPSLCLQIIEHDQTPSRELWASDIYRIAMDENEALPPLDPAGHELLMFGLQYPIWRFSRDREMLSRLTGGVKSPFDCDDLLLSPKSVVFSPATANIGPPMQDSGVEVNMLLESEAQHLESAVRKMNDLQQEWKRLLSALTKWERSLPLVKTFVRTNLDRSSLMSGLILYHLCFIRLLVPLEELHQTQYRTADNRVLDDSLLATVREWATSRRGRTAAERACNIWSIIAKETEVEESRRVRFNLLAFIGLHHGAVLLWAYAAAPDCAYGVDPLGSPLFLRSTHPIPVDRAHSKELMSAFVKLYDLISPAQWSSFAKATSILVARPFPHAPFE